MGDLSITIEVLSAPVFLCVHKSRSKDDIPALWIPKYEPHHGTNKGNGKERKAGSGRRACLSISRRQTRRPISNEREPEGQGNSVSPSSLSLESSYLLV